MNIKNAGVSGGVYVAVLGLCLLSLPVVYVYRTVHPTPTRITLVSEIGEKVDLWFPPGTAPVEGGYVSQTSSFYPTSYAYAVVTVPKSRLGQLYKQSTGTVRSQKERKKCRDWILQAPNDLNFFPKNWKASHAKNYKILYYAGGDAMLIDLDDSSTATVYMRSG